MIYFYSGTPGSGKSLHVAQDILRKLKTKKQTVIATFPINIDYLSKKGKKRIGKFIYKGYGDMTIDFLIEHARQNHILGKENQTLVIMDECQLIFNPREFSRSDRLQWITFFTQHRKLGYNFILVSQFDRLIDRQIRALFEYEIKHRKVNNFKYGMFFPVKTFIAVNYWYGVKEKIGIEFFIYRKKYAKIYDSFMFFEEFNNKLGTPAVAESGEERSEGVPGSVSEGVKSSLLLNFIKRIQQVLNFPVLFAQKNKGVIVDEFEKESEVCEVNG